MSRDDWKRESRVGEGRAKAGSDQTSLGLARARGTHDGTSRRRGPRGWRARLDWEEGFLGAGWSRLAEVCSRDTPDETVAVGWCGNAETPASTYRLEGR